MNVWPRARRMHRGTLRHHRGVTLVETATTLLALAAVSSLVLPMLSQIRRGVRGAHCLGNLKRIADACSTYAAADRHNLAVPVHSLSGVISSAVGEYEWGGKSGSGDVVSGTDVVSSLWGTQYGRGPATRPLNRVLYGALPDYQDNPGQGQVNWRNDAQLPLNVFHCPADFGYGGHHYQAFAASRLSSFDHYGNSYAATTLWVGQPGGDCHLLSNTPFRRPVSRVVSPATTIQIIENCGQFAWRKNFGIDGCFGHQGPATTVHGWHGRPWTFHATFSDGHAAPVRVEGHFQPQPDLMRYPSEPDPDQNYDTYRCVTIRGPGWRKDTLPSPPVKTDIECTYSGVLVILIP